MLSTRIPFSQAVIAIALLLLSVLVYRPSETGFWYQTLFDWMHVPVFGLMSLYVLSLIPESPPLLRRLLFAFAITVLLGIGSEIVQYPLGRSPSVEDVVADASGAASFLIFAYALRHRGSMKAVLLIAGLAIAAWTLSPLAVATQAILQRNAQFPIIFNGDGAAKGSLIDASELQMLTHWSSDRGRLYTHIRFDGYEPRLVFRDLVADWSSYSTLRLDIENESTDTLGFTLRIHDSAHRKGTQEHSDRYNETFNLEPGRTLLEISLREVRAAPAGRMMDISEIDALILFSNRENSGRTFRLYEIRLD